MSDEIQLLLDVANEYGQVNVTVDEIKQIRVDAIDECIKTVKDYFCKLLDEHEEWEIDSIDDFALIPNKNICKALKQLKEQKNEQRDHSGSPERLRR